MWGSNVNYRRKIINYDGCRNELFIYIIVNLFVDLKAPKICVCLKIINDCRCSIGYPVTKTFFLTLSLMNLTKFIV